MSDQVQKIELETARLRLERERLALDAEIRKRDIVMSISNAASRVWPVVKYGIGIWIVLVVVKLFSGG